MVLGEREPSGDSCPGAEVTSGPAPCPCPLVPVPVFKDDVAT